LLRLETVPTGQVTGSEDIKKRFLSPVTNPTVPAE
jgi:hypothetical protein